ncbi:nucleotide exchange factor GrpE [Desulfonatronovibrio magnus]|uniref:nucleotide exchange factor GrpE n=1 Tax=Desulfonatronovibrio magnus TaxID=698827 RepID=UPI0005EB03B5|nr:nucleotide exchange factor GrpE [Desulfonatronovibrio magnus]
MSEEKDRLDFEEYEMEGQDDPQEELEEHIEISFDELRSLCEEKICPECRLLKEEKDKALRAVAESDNYKKRLNREKEEFCKFAVSSFVEEIIPVVDNLELALEHGRKNDACKELVSGVDMTLSIFKQILEKNKLVQVGYVGEPFDPNFHEALAQEERDDMDHETVCHVMQKGYVLNDRLLRPAKVMVSKKSC